MAHTQVDLAALGLGLCSGSNGNGGGVDGGSTSNGSSSGEQQVWVTTVDLWPHTGRKHQLRRHLALVGHPLVGDPRYRWVGGGDALAGPRITRAREVRAVPSAAAMPALLLLLLLL